MRTVELIVFRHGETDWNQEHRIQGHTDIPLNPRGISQAQELAKRLAPWNLEYIFCSDLKRAQQTANIACPGIVPEISPALRECMMGDAEGMTRTELTQSFGAESWEHWRSHLAEHQHYAFPNGETKAQHRQRIQNYLYAVLKHKAFGCIGISTHGGSILRLIECCPNSPKERIEVTNCAAYLLRWDGYGLNFGMRLE